MKQKFNTHLFLLYLLVIVMSSCSDSSENNVVEPDLEIMGVGVDGLKTENIVYKNVNYQLISYMEGDTAKRLVHNEDYEILTNQIDGLANSMIVKVDKNNTLTYYIYKSAEELFAENPDLKEEHKAILDRTNTRANTLWKLKVIGWDHTNYNTPRRLAALCSIDCVPNRLKSWTGFVA